MPKQYRKGNWVTRVKATGLRVNEIKRHPLQTLIKRNLKQLDGY